MHLPFVDLKRQYISIKKEINNKIQNVLDRSLFIDGPFVESFEKEFAKYCNKKFCVGLNSGTDALLFGLLAYKISPGDEVITAPNSYFSSAMVISTIGATPVFVDINPRTGLIDPLSIERAITKKTKAIMPVHLTGLPANMRNIAKLAKTYNLTVIEDCCQSHGAKIGQKKVPYTHTGAFSFYPGKNLGAYGDAGAIVTDDARIDTLIRHLRSDGSVKKYVHTMFGYKSRMDAVQAAVLSVKLRHLDSWNNKRQQWASLYTKLLIGTKQVETPQQIAGSQGVYHLYQIKAHRRDELKQYLEKKGVMTVIHYPIPIHLQKPYRDLGYKKGMFPITESASKKILSLPMFPELKKEEVIHVCKSIQAFYA